MVWSCLKQRVHKNYPVGFHIDLSLERCSSGVCILALKAKHAFQLQESACTRPSQTAVGIGAQWVALPVVGTTEGWDFQGVLRILSTFIVRLVWTVCPF